MKVIKFDKKYESKFDEKIFTTIRDHDKKLIIDEKVLIKSPNNEFKAQIIKIEHSTLENEPIYRLLDDLCIDNDINKKPIDLIDFENEDKFACSLAYVDDRVLDEFKRIYPNIRWDSDIYIYTLKRCS